VKEQTGSMCLLFSTPCFHPLSCHPFLCAFTSCIIIPLPAFTRSRCHDHQTCQLSIVKRKHRRAFSIAEGPWRVRSLPQHGTELHTSHNVGAGVRCPMQGRSGTHRKRRRVNATRVPRARHHAITIDSTMRKLRKRLVKLNQHFQKRFPGQHF